MKKIISILRQPYPYYNLTEKLPLNAFIIFISVFLFLLTFTPFSVNHAEHRYSYTVICLVHAGLAAIIYFVFFLVINNLFSSLTKEENWKVYKAIGAIAILFFLVGVGSFLVRPLIYDSPENYSRQHFVDETVNTFLLGTLIFAGFTFYDFYRLLKANQSGALGFGSELEKHKTMHQNQLISISVENEPYELDLATFLFAKAEGNYTEFYFYKNSQLVKQLKRASLKSIEEQIAPLVPAAIRTHRAYFVNTSHITKMSGNAQGYQLYFHDIDLSVPVSRALIPAFKKLMQVN